MKKIILFLCLLIPTLLLGQSTATIKAQKIYVDSIVSNHGTTPWKIINGGTPGLVDTTANYYNGAVIDTIKPWNILRIANSKSRNKTHADYLCDGTSDEVQINTAIASLAHGGDVILDADTFFIASPIIISNSSIHLIGAGNGLRSKGTTLLLVSDIDAIKVLTPAPYNGALTGIALRDFNVRGLGKTDVGRGIYIANEGGSTSSTDNLEISNVGISNHGTAVDINQSDALNIHNNWFCENGGSAIILRYCYFGSVTNNIIADNTKNGIVLYSVSANPCNNMIIAHNQLVRDSIDVWVNAGQQIQILSNSFNSDSIAIQIDSSTVNSNISGNTMTSCVRYGILVTRSSFYNHISGNLISSCLNTGLRIDSSASQNEVTGNRIAWSTFANIYVTAHGAGNIFMVNRFHGTPIKEVIVSKSVIPAYFYYNYDQTDTTACKDSTGFSVFIPGKSPLSASRLTSTGSFIDLGNCSLSRNGDDLYVNSGAAGKNIFLRPDASTNNGQVSLSYDGNHAIYDGSGVLELSFLSGRAFINGGFNIKNTNKVANLLYLESGIGTERFVVDSSGGVTAVFDTLSNSYFNLYSPKRTAFNAGLRLSFQEANGSGNPITYGYVSATKTSTTTDGGIMTLYAKLPSSTTQGLVALYGDNKNVTLGNTGAVIPAAYPAGVTGFSDKLGLFGLQTSQASLVWIADSLGNSTQNGVATATNMKATAMPIDSTGLAAGTLWLKVTDGTVHRKF